MASHSATVAIDASDYAIAASLRQSGHPVAFFFGTLLQSEWHSALEKEAYAIIEALKKWHYLISHHFGLVIDQKSVSFMYNPSTTSQIKNEKIAKWEMRFCFWFARKMLMPFLSMICGSVKVIEDLLKLHKKICVIQISPECYMW